MFSDDPSEGFFPATKSFVRIKQKSGDPPISHVRLNCFNPGASGKQLVQISEPIEPGEMFELFPDDSVSFQCSFIWVGFGGLVGTQNFLVFSTRTKEFSCCQFSFYCRICLWTFDHQGFELYNNSTKSYVHVHNWIFEQKKSVTRDPLFGRKRFARITGAST
ncbi:hypothetical protein R1flu_001599 [Riccia fluitans]|uniref:S-protein homolog n=1 Tax=Riccia fluitans TaxID=41844 RepID=A0ABD1Y7P8_9MARC